MWWRSASFILDKQDNDRNDAAFAAAAADPESLSLSSPPPHSSMADTAPNPNPKISAYYQTRAAHHGVVTSDWLAQAQAAVGRDPDGISLPPEDEAREADSGKSFSIIDQFNSWRKQPDLAEAVAAIRALAAVIRNSEATTMMELEIELKKASDSLKSWDTTSISLTAGCDLFMRYVTRTSALEYEDFNSAKSRLIERAEKFGEISCKARRIIAMLSQDFIFDGCTILVHGFSRVVWEVLKTAAQNKKLFRVFCTEGRPDRTGLRLSNELAKLDVPVKLLIDSAVAYSMDEVDMVFVGADGVVESGGIINMMGTYQIALVAHSMNKPVYVAAESYKKFMWFGLWKGYRCSDDTEREPKKPGFQVQKTLWVPKKEPSLCKVIEGLDKNQPSHYKIESWTSKSTCKIVNQYGALVAEVKRKQSACGVLLGEDVLTMVVEPSIDHSMIMGLVVTCSLINSKM